jgi:Uma2 family endonuclease
MSVMTATRTGLPADRPLTADDLDPLPDDGNRYELDDGVLVVSPAPGNIHQLVVSRLQTLLDAACPPQFLVVSANGVAITRTQYRIPDLVIVRTQTFDLAAQSITAPPALAIEIASPSTALYDRNRKKDVYAGFGIAAYWIVTPSQQDPRLTAFELRRGGYRQIAEVSGDESFTAVLPFAAEIVPSALVAMPGRH